MKRCAFLILTFLFVVSVFGAGKRSLLEKAHISFTVSHNQTEDLTSCSRPVHTEIELFSSPTTNGTQAPNRYHSLLAYTGAEALQANNTIGSTLQNTPRCYHLSHKAYLRHIHPSHNFW